MIPAKVNGALAGKGRALWAEAKVRDWPDSECARKLAKNRRCKSPTGKVQPTTPTPSDARGSVREDSREAFTGETTGQV